MDELLSFDDILANNNLTGEQKKQAIEARSNKYIADLDRQKWLDIGRGGLGSVISGYSFHPVLNIPYVGTGLGGAMYEAGQAITEGKKLPEIAKRAGTGFMIGETVGAIPYVGKGANKLSGGKIGNVVNKGLEKVNPLIDKVKTLPAVQKIEDALMTDIKAFNPFKQTQTAYHGSPYDFNKFSNEAIGTGEGANVHGRGHYVAFNKDIADRRYRERLTASNAPYLVDNKPYNINYDRYDFSEAGILGDINYYGGVDNYLNKLEKDALYAENLIKKYENTYTPEEIQADEYLNKYYEEAIDELDLLEPKIDFVSSFKGKDIKKNTGQLYKVTIPKEENFLREDLPFDKQSKIVQKGLKNIQDKRLKEEGYNSIDEVNARLDALNTEYENAVNRRLAPWEPNPVSKIQAEISNMERLKTLYSGGGYPSNIYNGLTNIYGAQRANDILRKQGIKGISYNGGIDGESRVVFNPNELEIVRKFFNEADALDYFKKIQPNMGSIVNGLEREPINKPKWKLFAKENIIGKSVDVPGYGTVTFTNKNLGKDYPYNLPEYASLLDRLGHSSYAFSTNYYDEKDRLYDHLKYSDEKNLFDFLIEVIQDNKGDIHHNYKMMKDINKGDKP